MQRNIINVDKNHNQIDQYEMKISDSELSGIMQLVEKIDKKIISKKVSTFNLPSPRYTILKPNPNTFLLIGEGPSKDKLNNYHPMGLFGSGSFGRVKVGVAYQRTGTNDYTLDKDNYAIKILHKNLSDTKEVLQQKYKAANKELNFFKLVHQSGDVIISEDYKKLYIIMKLLPGKKIYRLYFDHMDYPELFELIKSTTEELERIHQLGICHGDTHFGNILYDDHSKRVYFIDFGKSQFITSDSHSIDGDWYKLLYNFYSTLEIVVKNDNKVINLNELEGLIDVLNRYSQAAENGNFSYATFKHELDTVQPTSNKGFTPF